MRIIYNTFFALFLCVQLNAQNGLERIIVEKYYVSTESDKAVDGDGGELPVGSVTYRVFVDMLPGYIFQAAYGTNAHELKIASSTRFFNNEDRGGKYPTYSRTQAEGNTVMLDSWLSVGDGMRDHTGLLKSRDNGENTIVNSDGVLQNADSRAGIPISEQDGVIPGTNDPVTVVGFFDTDLSVLDDANDSPIPTIISTRDGAWSALNGSVGPDPEENIVLIGQFTTDGIFEFELNLQLRNQQTFGIENYVASNPTGNEILFESLIHIDSLDFESAVQDFAVLKDKVTVYPNPTSRHLTIALDPLVVLNGNNDRYSIQALNGSAIINGRIVSHNTNVDLSRLAPGMYLLFLEVGSKNLYSQKVVLTK